MVQAAMVEAAKAAKAVMVAAETEAERAAAVVMETTVAKMAVVTAVETVEEETVEVERWRWEVEVVASQRGTSLASTCP